MKTRNRMQSPKNKQGVTKKSRSGQTPSRRRSPGEIRRRLGGRTGNHTKRSDRNRKRHKSTRGEAKSNIADKIFSKVHRRDKSFSPNTRSDDQINRSSRRGQQGETMGGVERSRPPPKRAKEQDGDRKNKNNKEKNDKNSRYDEKRKGGGIGD